ncbi:MAG: hypothetical protein QME57_04225 [Patescibacteria group bacterium]|nr:hypothetical protein [Patescibacteria group bacterium]
MAYQFSCWCSSCGIAIISVHKRGWRSRTRNIIKFKSNQSNFLYNGGWYFKVIYFYGFLRQRFENAFGIIPGIILAALFYSFHHAGFQPEFVKLFFVGIMYVSVFRITKNALIISPFFWGMGACCDVLVSFGAMKE